MVSDDEDGSAQVTLARRIYLEEADQFSGGWQQVILLEAERMRRELPYADFIDIRLIAERRSP